MTTLCKLTDQEGYTRRGSDNETLWAPGWVYSAVGCPDQPLCSDGWIHAYEDLLVGVFMNPIHANIQNPRGLECRGEIGLRDGQLKCGCRTLEAVRWVDCPQPTTEQRVRFAIGCAWSRGSDEWRTWAAAWLSGKDRSEAAAEAAAWAAWAAEAAAWAAEAAAWAARAAAWAAEAAAWAARAARAARAAEAAEAAARVAEAAARAAEAAAEAAAIDLPTIAAWAMTDSLIVPERGE